MPRLPPALEPLFPVVKRGHRFATRRVGAISRAISPALGERGVPLHAHPTSAATAATEPGAVLHEAGPAEHLEREAPLGTPAGLRTEEHTSELQSLMRTSNAVLCLKKKK